MTDQLFDDVFIHMSKMGKSIEPKMYEYLLKATHKDFQELVTWQTSAGGKRLRPALSLLISQAFGVSPDNPEALAAAAGIELIHTYSLIIDDIIDRGDLRRGKPTTRARYGDEFALLSAMIHREAIYEAAKATGKYFNEIIQIYSNTIRKLTEGERLDILFEQKNDRSHEYFKSHRYQNVSIKDYRNMIVCKTAGLIAAACSVGAVVGGASYTERAIVEKFGWAIGVAFQIVDDFLDIFAISDDFGKEVYKDIIEQKLGNFIVINALQLLESKEAVLFKQYLTDTNLSDEERVSKCVPLIIRSQVKDFAIKEAEKWSLKAKMHLKTITFKNEEVKSLLENIADFIVSRAF